MGITRSFRPLGRRGTVLPMLALCLVGLFGFTALAIDLGVLAVSRTDCQNAADVAALIGCRTLNNKPTSVNNDLALAVANAKNGTTANYHLNTNFTTAQIQKVESGQFLYDAATQQFKVATWYNVTTDQSLRPPSGSWTAIRVTISFTQPTYFAKVFGITSMPTGAVASAVYRPRDTAFVLDMTGSMGYASQFNYNGASHNPDDLVPSFGHYVSVQSSLRASGNEANGSGEAISMNNYTITTPGGLPIVRDFYSDLTDPKNPTASRFPVVPGNLKNAFHCIPAGKETPGNATTYTPPTYDFGSYDAFDLTRTNGPTPAPDTFKTMTGTNYKGDRYRRADGSINKSNASWATGSTSTRAATNAIELLGYKMGTGTKSTTVQTSGGTDIATEDKFRDAVWEKYGYDLDIVQYRTDRAAGDGKPKDISGTSTYTATLVVDADKFQGYSMGPGYWGKTFFIWPPDPRTPVGQPGVAGHVAGDWRQRFFQKSDGTAFDPQGDNKPSTSAKEGINGVLLNGSSQMFSAIGSTTSPVWKINYANVLKWIKSGPQTLPPNLRAGRVLYYTSIPDDVDTSTGTAEVKADKVFWKNYIDYVLTWNNTETTKLYGGADSWLAAPKSITTNDLNTWTGPGSTWTSAKPYMRYNDSPLRPRLHTWFGPLSMMDFLKMPPGGDYNRLPGNCHEAQSWQLKAGMNSVIDDVRNNRPNDYVGMVMFSATVSGSTPVGYNGSRVPIGQDYNALKNALFYPKSLLTTINAGNNTAEVRPYTVNTTAKTMGEVAPDEIPNAFGSTDPNTGLAYAFNILSPSSITSTDNGPGGYGTLKGRRGAGKVVIFETDGVPNTYSGLSSGTKTMNPVLMGYDTYYDTAGWSSDNDGNGNSSSMTEAYKVVQQIVKPMETTGKTNGGTNKDSGLSLPNAPARVYPIAFGDLFDEAASPNATFRTTAKQFMAKIAQYGNTGPAGATTIPDIQIITGSYEQRISRLKDCMERIFETGVSVALVE